VTLIQEHAFIDDTVKALVHTVDQFGEKAPAEGLLSAQVLDAATEQPLFDAHVVETGHVRQSPFAMQFIVMPLMASRPEMSCLLSSVICLFAGGSK
jgi:hypothetical protein